MYLVHPKQYFLKSSHGMVLTSSTDGSAMTRSGNICVQTCGKLHSQIHPAIGSPSPTDV